MSDLPVPSIIRSSRGKALRSVGLSLIYLLFCLFALRGDHPPPVIYLALGVLALSTLSLAAGALVPRQLVIDEQGLEWKGFVRSWRIAWNDVARFRLRRWRSRTTVLIDYAADPELRMRLRRPRQIPGLLERDPAEVQHLLQTHLQAWRTASSEAPPTTPIVVEVPEPRRAMP